MPEEETPAAGQWGILVEGGVMNIEVIGRNWLITELAHANIDVALPVRADLKVDLLAEVDPKI